MEFGKQMSIYDFLSESTEEIKPGCYIPNLKEKVGRKIPFRELKEYIGKIVIMSLDSKFTSFKAVKITSFWRDSERVYTTPLSDAYIGEYLHDHMYTKENREKCKFLGMADRIGYSDDKRGKENSWVSEMHCNNGRYEPKGSHSECFFEIA